MAMNGNTMGTAIANALKAANPNITTAQLAALTAIWQTIATSMVSHITTNAVTNPGTMNVGGTAVTGNGTIT
jgi:hypothetical protein